MFVILTSIMNIGVAPGKYRIPHNGHEWLIQRGVEKYDKLYVVVAQIPESQSPFSLEERMEILRKITEPFKNADVESLEEGQFLVDYAKAKDARYVLRSLKEDDLTREFEMWDYNEDFDPEILPEFLRSPKKYRQINSTRLIEIVGLENGIERVRPYVPEIVYQKLLEKKS